MSLLSQIRKIFEAILQMKQKAYPGASGWTYTDQGGFNITDETRDAWDNFSKAHPIFKPFTTSRWVHFRTVDEIMPSRARGCFVFSAGFTQPVVEDVPSQSQSQDDDDTQSERSQPLTDSWSQLNDGESQPASNDIPASQSLRCYTGYFPVYSHSFCPWHSCFDPEAPPFPRS
jgi:hypothetical protein